MSKYFKILFFVAIPIGGWYMWIRSRPVERVRKLVERGNFPEAVETVETFLAKTKWLSRHKEDHEDLLALAAKSYIGKGALESAEHSFRELEKLNPSNYDAAIGLGIISAFRGNSKFGKEYLNRAIQLDGSRPEPVISLVKLLINERDFDQAQELIVEGLSKFPGSDSLMELSGDVFFSVGRFSDALNQYLMLQNADPKNRNIRQKIALTYYFSGDVNEAYKALLELKPTWNEDVGFELDLATILCDIGRRDEALSMFDKSFQSDRRRVFAGISLAQCYISKGDASRAEAILDSLEPALIPMGIGSSVWNSIDDLEKIQLVRESARSQRCHYYLARSELALISCNYGSAIEYVEKAMNMDNGVFDCYRLSSEVCRLKGDVNGSLKWSEMAVDKFSGHPAAKLLKAKTLLDMGKFENAKELAASVESDYPMHSKGKAIVSMILLKNGQIDLAYEKAVDAVERNEFDPMAQLALALAHREKKEFAESERCFIKAIDMDVRFAEARFEYGKLLKSVGRKKEAFDQFDAARILEPNVFKKTN